MFEIFLFHGFITKKVIPKNFFKHVKSVFLENELKKHFRIKNFKENFMYLLIVQVADAIIGSFFRMFVVNHVNLENGRNLNFALLSGDFIII